jgi:hypothetical protein
VGPIGLYYHLKGDLDFVLIAKHLEQLGGVNNESWSTSRIRSFWYRWQHRILLVSAWDASICKITRSLCR